MHPFANRVARSRRAFTFTELLVASACSVLLASIIYTAGSEMLISFARNISINRSYSDARIALERMAQTIESAGHVPVLINNDGLTLATTSPAAGIRFYRTSSTPLYLIASGTTASTTLPITVPSGKSPVQVGDLISIPVLGFQGLVTSFTSAGTTETLSFGGSTIASGCVPALTSTYNFATTTYSCLQFTQVEFVAVGTQLRYYSRAPTTAAAFNTTSNYYVLANLVSTPTNPNQLLPFQLGPSPTVSITICAEGPDYNHCNLGTADTFTQMQTSLASRSPLLLRGPF